MKSQNNLTYHIFVEGRVQGVGYRRFAQKNAEAKSLLGWARNLLDGRVEVFAVGPESQLEAFCDVLRQGPPFAQVREIVVKIIEDKTITLESQTQFLILPDVELNTK